MTLPIGHCQRVTHQPCLHALAHRPANDFARRQLEDNSQIKPALVCMDVSHVGHPGLVGLPVIKASLLGLLRHWQYPERETPSERHRRATGNVSRYDSIQAYFTAIPSRRTPPLFLQYQGPSWCWPTPGVAVRFPLLNREPLVSSVRLLLASP